MVIVYFIWKISTVTFDLQTRSWVLAIGFSVAFGAMFAKTWRVFVIFNAPHKQNRVRMQLLSCNVGEFNFWERIKSLNFGK